MEIAPIPGIRALQAVKGPQADFRPPEIFDIEGQERRQGRKAAGAEEDDKDDLMLDAENDSGEEHEGPPRIDYFA
jgi:hypothetical protein